MLYDFSITTSTTASETSKQVTILSLLYGIIHLLEVEFPPGSTGQLHVQIFRSIHQIWPTNIDGNFHSDGHAISSREYYPLIDEPFELEVHTWNDSTDQTREVIIRIGILPPEVLAGYIGLRAEKEEEYIKKTTEVGKEISGIRKTLQRVLGIGG